MALNFNFQTSMGFTQENAYARIETFSGNKDYIQLNVIVHHCDQCRIDQLAPIGFLPISVKLTDGASLQQMYDALKLDSNFAGATDC